MVKVCKRCQKEKSLYNDFWTTGNGRHRTVCKDCMRKKQRAYKEQHREQVRERQRFYRRAKRLERARLPLTDLVDEGWLVTLKQALKKRKAKEAYED